MSLVRGLKASNGISKTPDLYSPQVEAATLMAMGPSLATAFMRTVSLFRGN